MCQHPLLAGGKSRAAAVGVRFGGDGEDLRDPPGPRAHDDNAVAEIDGFINIVRDEHHRDAGGGLQPPHLLLHLDAGERVERGKRLVEQKNLRFRDETAHDGGALRHAAGELCGVALRVVGKADRD